MDETSGGDVTEVGTVITTSFSGLSLSFISNYSPHPAFPIPDADQKKFNSRLVAPTILRNEPFGENVEGLSHCGDQSYAIET